MSGLPEMDVCSGQDPKQGPYRITAGFMPLLDSAILIAALECGFADQEGVNLTLVRENSWANIRDRMAVGHFQVAHMLAPMPIACNLGLTPWSQQIIAPMALGLGGNAVTVSLALWQAMRDCGAPSDGCHVFDPAMQGRALAAVVADRAKRGQKKLRFAVVHAYSGHNIELRYWLAACGIMPDRDIEIVVLSPPLMADALMGGGIDGYCVGEPWNTASVTGGHGRIVTVKAAIWRSSPEKVLGVHAGWAEKNPEALAALLRAMTRAALWCANSDHHADLARILSRESYVGQPAGWMMAALDGSIVPGGPGSRVGVMVPDFLVPFARAATFPWKSHAMWFYAQLARWNYLEHSAENACIAANTYRPDLYRAAISGLGYPLPGANAKVEGALTSPTPVGANLAGLTLGPDGFFTGELFDPDDMDNYILRQKAVI
ncbi:Nitrate binding protein nrtA [Granulibacter bethesdensis]|uniref:Nitrate binding protein nrtA n=1 Tax=Granulibacter bethesdensis TaxID=364410 RepID=A0AAC9KAL5_9PROT|nr:CmpA/NrtA family ABC transporter substrate-binding protein [Granulibacter bethesdensis]APH55031.1 Nitrate binding protein nrtA [Granulibacter bethesdensis]APH62617.1 Nitrate binding protein nrtA [Granulibacter bethesdensis]